MSLESPNDRQKKLLFSNEQSDVLFKVGRTGELIYAHKAILTRDSEVFFSLFIDDSNEINHHENPVKIDDIEPATFKEVLRYIYCREDKLTASNVFDIYVASQRYMVPGLLEKCKLFLKSTNEDNVLTIFNNNQQYKVDSVDEICLEIIRNNPLKYFRHFKNLSEPALEIIAACRTMNCQKEQIYKAIREALIANRSTAEIQPKWEGMQCRKLRFFGDFQYSSIFSTFLTMNVKKKLYLHGLGVFVGKKPGVSTEDDVSLKVKIEEFNVTVSKSISLKQDLYVEEIVWARLTVLKECRIDVSFEGPRGELFSLKKFQPAHSDDTVEMTVLYNNSASYVAYLLYDID